MPAAFRSTVFEFVNTSPSEINHLLAYSVATDHSELRDQTIFTWHQDIAELQNSLSGLLNRLPTAANWCIALEFKIPRRAKRIDAVIMMANCVVVLELKTSANAIGAAVAQAEDYALDLRNYHEASRNLDIISLVIIKQPLQEHRNGDAATPVINYSSLSDCLFRAFAERQHSSLPSINVEEWFNSGYFPVPRIIDAAIHLYRKQDIREIAHSQASQQEVERATSSILEIIRSSEASQTKSVCLLTGVPGAGKTLVGLNIAHSPEMASGTRSGCHFMSGNGPLVNVLQEAIAREHQAKNPGVTKAKARDEAAALVQIIHKFVNDELGLTEAPWENVLIFDEAQRAWDSTHLVRFWKDKKRHPKYWDSPISEPEAILTIMDRKPWAVVVALVGGGQEINSGEAGLAEWGRSIAQTFPHWNIYASPEAVNGGSSVAGNRLFENTSPNDVQTLLLQVTDSLHLDVSTRSIRSQRLADWVHHLLLGQREAALNAKSECDNFPVFLTRDLAQAKEWLRSKARGSSRAGLVGSSGADRLRAEGLEASSGMHRSFSWEAFFLNDRTDVRSSDRLEVFATEFEIQGLELDWTGICWDLDFSFDPQTNQWVTKNLNSLSQVSKWSPIKSEDPHRFRFNAYRVLLTRARQGMVIFVPRGETDDGTRNPREYDRIASILVDYGARPLYASS